MTSAGVEVFSNEILDGELPKNIIFDNAVEFSEYIETLARNSNLPLTETLIGYVEEGDLEYEDLSRMLTNSLKEKIAFEMGREGLIDKGNTITNFFT